MKANELCRNSNGNYYFYGESRLCDGAIFPVDTYNVTLDDKGRFNSFFYERGDTAESTEVKIVYNKKGKIKYIVLDGHKFNLKKFKFES